MGLSLNKYFCCDFAIAEIRPGLVGLKLSDPVLLVGSIGFL